MHVERGCALENSDNARRRVQSCVLATVGPLAKADQSTNSSIDANNLIISSAQPPVGDKKSDGAHVLSCTNAVSWVTSLRGATHTVTQILFERLLPSMMQDPLEIATDLLETTKRAICLGDEDEFLRSFNVPHPIGTGLGNNLIANYAELSAIFGEIRALWSSLKVDQFERTCLSAMYIDADTIAQVHASHVFRAGALIQPVYKALSTFKRIDGRWRVADASYDLKKNHQLASVLLGPQSSRARSVPLFRVH